MAPTIQPAGQDYRSIRSLSRMVMKKFTTTFTKSDTREEHYLLGVESIGGLGLSTQVPLGRPRERLPGLAFLTELRDKSDSNAASHAMLNKCSAGRPPLSRLGQDVTFEDPIARVHPPRVLLR
ncbi:MAG: hypothetical protein ACK5AZ_03010 [Bryobacteraceae bacterium]